MIYWADPYGNDEYDDDDCCYCGCAFDDFGWCPFCDYDESGFDPHERAVLETALEWDLANADSLYVDECLAEDGDELPF